MTMSTDLFGWRWLLDDSDTDDLPTATTMKETVKEAQAFLGK